MKKEKATVPSEPKFDFRTIKTFEDACKAIRVTTALPTLANGCQELLKTTIAGYKLMVIFQAINAGWTPDWGNSDQAKWFPWFWVLPSGSGFSASLASYLRRAYDRRFPPLYRHFRKMQLYSRAV